MYIEAIARLIYSGRIKFTLDIFLKLFSFESMLNMKGKSESTDENVALFLFVSHSNRKLFAFVICGLIAVVLSHRHCKVSP
jgi:hypothetical protein